MHFHLVNVVVRKREAWKFDPNTGGPVFPLSVIPGSARLPDANEKGWKETVRMNPGEAVTVDMKFDLPPGKPAAPESNGRGEVVTVDFGDLGPAAA